jgi:hypothetical protein
MLGTQIVIAPMLHPYPEMSYQLPAMLMSAFQILLICVALTVVVYHQRTVRGAWPRNLSKSSGRPNPVF